MMCKIKVLFFLLVLLVGCTPFGGTEKTPLMTPELEIDTATLEPTSQATIVPTEEPVTLEATIVPTEEPVTFDFGGKAVYTQIYFDDFESIEEKSGEIKTPGLRLNGNATVTTDEVIDGEASVILSDWGSIETDPTKIQLLPHNRYLFEYDYRIISPGNKPVIIWSEFRPDGPFDPNTRVASRHMLSNAEINGRFSGGSLMGDASSYALFIIANENTTIIIDNLRIFRQDTISLAQQPQRRSKLSNLPFPRLGNYIKTDTTFLAQEAPAEGIPLTYSVKEIEDRLAMGDVVIGLATDNQVYDPDLVRRLRNRNPDLVILPARIFSEQGAYNLHADFGAGVSEDWIVKDTSGNPVIDPVWNMYQMDVSPYSPLNNGQTFNEFHVDWVVNTVLASGVWDGIWFDNLFGNINYHIPNSRNPPLLDYDINRNGVRDETPAQISDIFRTAAIEFLESIRDQVGDLEIIMGNAGPFPDMYLAPFVNGYLFECWNSAWESDFPTRKSEASWRRSLDEYFTMQSHSMKPTTNVLQGCGTLAVGAPEGKYLEPTPEDIKEHRFTLGTALLGDGFYEYDLWGFWSAPYWFDEFTVDENGVAIEDQAYKGYLGHAIADAIELTSPSTEVWKEDFEAGVLPAEMWTEGQVSVTQTVENVIDGSGSLIIDNPDHTSVSEFSAGTDIDGVNLSMGNTYVVEFDWKILETLDGSFYAQIENREGWIDKYDIPGVIAGDFGKVKFHTTLNSGELYSLVIQLFGGGKVAIDNIQITVGGAGPWRRDFENGFVLVNPFNKHYTFSPEELSGSFNRTGVKRILGTQAPDVNSGQSVTGSLTLEPFDAILLMADTIPVE